jgi:caa(3)-type oxidase subunit IV
MTAHDESVKETPGAVLFGVWVGIVALGALSFVLRYSHIGSYSLLTGFLIAAVQASLLAFFFMELGREVAVVRFAFAACLVLFAFLLALTVADVLTRSTPPMDNPPGMAPRSYG